MYASAMSAWLGRRASRRLLVLLTIAGVIAFSSFGRAPSRAAAVDPSLSFGADADTYVRADNPTANYGSATTIQTDGSPAKDFLLRFTVSGVGAETLSSAKLRLYNVDPSSFGGAFYRVADNTWTEGTVTWNSAPAADATPLDSLSAVVANTWYEVDLTSLITGDGTYSLRVTSTSSNGADYTSKEGAVGFRPELIVTLGEPPDSTAPTAEITTPTGGDTVSDLVSVEAAASDDVGVVELGLLVDGVTWASLTAEPYSFSLDTLRLTNGSHDLSVRAADAAGNIGTSAVVSVNVDNPVLPSALSFPVRGAFYYPWFPETWTVAGQPVHYEPTLGLYDSSLASVVDSHIAALEAAKIDLGIVSWWGPGHHSESTRVPLLLDRTTELGAKVRWAFYYESESTGDPTVAQIQADLQYILANYAVRPEYATMYGKPVIFVYSTDTTCDVVDRWTTAAAGQWYISLKAFSGHLACANQPDAWHQYSGASSSDEQAGNSYTISPGYWQADEATPRLARDPDRWSQNIRDMVASGEPWQLIVSFNEWGEGTAVESSVEFGSVYLDALAEDGGTAPPVQHVIFAAAGDHGANSRTDASLAALDSSGANFYLALGDMDYDETVTDAAWCDYVKDRLPTLGASFPFELVSGNHEEQGGPNGYIVNHAACLPDRLNSSIGPGSQYGAEYYFDYPLASPLLRVIMIPPHLTIENIDYQYFQGGARYAWLASTIDSARAAGIPWVVVGMHEICLTAGQKTCEIGADLMNLLIEKKVDLVLQGHDHNYQRSKQLALNSLNCPAVPVAAYDPNCVIDDGSDGVYTKGAGVVFVISGTFGRGQYPIDSLDPEVPYFASLDATSSGFLEFTVTPERIDAEFISSIGAFSDKFSLLDAQSPPPETVPVITSPGSPAGFQAFAEASNRVDLSWTAGSGGGAVDHYDVFRDGASIVSVAAPWFVDNAVTGGRTYTYWVIAYDAAGNPSLQSASLVVTTPGVTSLSFEPVADASVRADKPNQNRGSVATIQTDGRPTKDILIRFAVTGVGTGTVTSAKLHLYNVDRSSFGGAFYRVADNTWNEGTVTWNSAPAADATPIASLGAVVANTWYEVDLTSLIPGDGMYSLRVTSTSSNGADYTSKEGAVGFRPELVVTFEP
jgi:Bacterial Ig domain/Glycosyl hydrolase family 99/Calcineurin-like phosphoesterase